MPQKTIEVTDPRLGNAGPTISIPLPYTASTHRIRTYIFSLPILALIGLSLFALASIPGAISRSPGSQALLPFIAIPLMVAFAVALIGVLISAIRDLYLPQPIVTIDDAGILDHRISNQPIGWNEISRIVSYAKVNGGILLELKQERGTHFNPFRVGTVFHIWRKPHNAAYVSMNAALGPFFPANIVFACARENDIPVFEKGRLGGITQIATP